MGTYEFHDERFRACVDPDAEPERLHTGGTWLEGPAWIDGGLVFSDVPGNVMWRYEEATGEVREFRRPSEYANGNTIDREGRLVTCEHGDRRVTRTEHDGSITVLADRWDGKRLNSPNDVVVRSDGSIWFTDPSYGIDSDTEGTKAESEIGVCNVYRVGPDGGEVALAADGFDMPNGLAFSPDERLLYVADSGGAEDSSRPRHVRVFEVGDDLRLSRGDVLVTCPNGVVDGLRVDADGRLWTSGADGVYCFGPDGTLLGRIALPETVANLEFGGERRDRLFITATSSLYAVSVRARGAG